MIFRKTNDTGLSARYYISFGCIKSIKISQPCLHISILAFFIKTKLFSTFALKMLKSPGFPFSIPLGYLLQSIMIFYILSSLQISPATYRTKIEPIPFSQKKTFNLISNCSTLISFKLVLKVDLRKMIKLFQIHKIFKITFEKFCLM